MEKIFFALFVVLLGVGVFIYYPDDKQSNCSGSAKCFSGQLDKIIDGDTIMIGGELIRLSLVNTPEKSDIGYNESIRFVESVCPVGSEVLVDEDDLQISRSHRRIVAVVYCGEKMINLNEYLLDNGHGEILDIYCDKSEFSNDEWVKSSGIC